MSCACIREVCRPVFLLGCQLPDFSPRLPILVFPEFSLVPNRESSTNGSVSLSSLPSTTSLTFLNQISAYLSGHPTSTKPSQVHQLTLSDCTLYYWLHSHCSSIIPSGCKRASITHELRVQVTNNQIPVPPVISCVTLGNYLTSLCLSHKMGGNGTNHRIITRIRGINACNVL